MFFCFFVCCLVFVWVIVILIMFVGVLVICMLLVGQYLDVVLLVVKIFVIYIGVFVEILENSVIQVIEQQFIGFDYLFYFSFISSFDGLVSIIVIFEQGIDLDIVQVQV